MCTQIRQLYMCTVCEIKCNLLKVDIHLRVTTVCENYGNLYGVFNYEQDMSQYVKFFANKLLQKSKSPPDEFGRISQSISLIHVIQRVNYGLITYSSNAKYFFVIKKLTLTFKCITLSKLMKKKVTIFSIEIFEGFNRTFSEQHSGK